ncbi:hypothetical protein DNK47_03185 [Mycoplasma wenyonii]|uniref:Uncharacterized protein n=1 Tax=Mycoplasma wenyonii TaxID=65123 RepID=A0A328PTI2_9MOLU|nr:hypothetical protein [Mycoplasma wenyonii]RAO94781.1 hypothetical protein DNK47_03185 [Mycoplasma wenyonii]
MTKNESLHPLGKYIRLSREKNTQLLATRHFGLSASEGLVELPFDKGKRDKSSYWILRKGQIAVDLMHLGQVREFAFERYTHNDLGIISNIHTVFSISDFSLDGKYLFLILKSQRKKNILLHYACHGVEMVLPWEDFCNLPIRVPPPASKKS